MSDDMPQARGRAEALGGVSGFSDPTQGRRPNRLLRPSHAVSAAQVTKWGNRRSLPESGQHLRRSGAYDVRTGRLANL